MDGQAELSGLFARGKLASTGGPVTGSAHLRIFLGDVELLFVAEMDLPHAGSTIPARVRNAVAWVSWVYSVCAGVVCAEKFHLAQGAEVAVVNSKSVITNHQLPLTTPHCAREPLC